MKNSILLLLLIIMTILGAFGGFFFKKSTEKIRVLKDLLKCKELYIGAILYFMGSLINIYILKYLSYTIVLPMTGITYIWTLLISNKYLNEKITKNKKIGITLILLGVLLIGIN